MAVIAKPLNVVTLAAVLLSLQCACSGSAQLVDGQPTLSNDQVIYRWAKAEHGAGLISIYDRVREKELLQIDPTAAPWWKVKLKSGKTVQGIRVRQQRFSGLGWRCPC